MPRTSAQVAEAHRIFRQLFEVTDRARLAFTTVAGDLGLTALQARAIMLLEQPVAMRELAGHLACDASNVTGLADRLETLDAIERVPGQDRRIKLLRLTPNGKRLRAKLEQRVVEASTVTAKLTATERKQLAALLDKILA